jgi:polysaccharide deacetylase 2 family uncharacterized protein YibQ
LKSIDGSGYRQTLSILLKGKGEMAGNLPKYNENLHLFFTKGWPSVAMASKSKKTKKKKNLKLKGLRRLLVPILVAGIAFGALWQFGGLRLPSGMDHLPAKAKVQVKINLPPLPQWPATIVTHADKEPPPVKETKLSPAEPPLRDIAREAEEAEVSDTTQIWDRASHGPQAYQMEEALPKPAPEHKVFQESEKIEPPVATGPARIALIIDDMGLSGPLSAQAVRLPAPVTLAYLPYAPHLQDQVNHARTAGHTIMLHMPMQPRGNENPGPLALRNGQEPDEWVRMLDEALSRMEGIAGVNNHMGSAFTENRAGMAYVAHALKARGLFFVDSRTSGKSVAGDVMDEAGVPLAERDIFLDHTISDQAIRAALVQAENLARRKGFAVVIGHPHSQTLRVLHAWLPQAQKRGVTLVPVETVVE